MTEQPARDAARYLRVPANSCLRVEDGERWVGSVVVRVGTYHVALRASSLEIHTALRSALGRHLVEDPQAPASYGIYESRPSLKTARPLYHVYEGCSHIFTTPSVERAIVVVAGYLERLLPREEQNGDVLELAVLGIIGSEGAMLVPWSLPYKLPQLEQRLSRFGLRQLEGASVTVDPATTELIVPRPRLVDEDHLVGGRSSEGRDDPSSTPGRRRISGWVFVDRAPGGRLSRAHAVAHGMKLVYAWASPGQQLRNMAMLVRGLDVLVVERPDEVVEVARDRVERTGVDL